jgi:Uma2 family endonuclease
MSASSNVRNATNEAEPLKLRRFTVDEYHRLGDSGILTTDDRVELLQGLITSKMIHSPRHDATVSLLEQQLRPLLPPEQIIRIQSAITTADSEPEPDLAIVLGPPLRYRRRHPRGMDIALVIEVADSSLTRDRLKAAIYAAEAIGQYWIVNLRDQVLEIYHEPGPQGYAVQHVLRAPQSVELQLPGQSAHSLAIGEWVEGDGREES